MHSLDVRRLSKTYDDGVRALKDVSLSISDGLYGLLGPNGAGKSTLMRTVATLQTPDCGTVRFDGIDACEQPEELRRRLGYLPQEFGVYPNVSARRLLDHLAVLKGLRPRSERRKQVDALLQRTNLEEHRDRAVADFSGGMRRRFGIAQALLGDPELLIVDEPTSGLDPEERHRVHDLLSEVGEEMVVLLSTHIVDDVHRLCSRMAVLCEGRIVEEGDPERLTGRLDGRVWRKTVARDEVEAHRESMDVISHHLHAGRVRLRVRAERCPGEGFEPAEPELEDVYFTALRSTPSSPSLPRAY